MHVCPVPVNFTSAGHGSPVSLCGHLWSLTLPSNDTRNPLTAAVSICISESASCMRAEVLVVIRVTGGQWKDFYSKKRAL